MIKNTKIKIRGMYCNHCEDRLTKGLLALVGMDSVHISYKRQTANISYDSSVLTMEEIFAKVEDLGYEAVKSDSSKPYSQLIYTASVFAIIILLYLALVKSGLLNRLVPSELANSGMGLSMLFLIGIITSIHCIAMCGGINLSQSISKKRTGTNEPAMSNSRGARHSNSILSTLIPSLLYNAGRVVSYTIIGAILGGIGMLIGGGDAGLPLMLQGGLKLLAGLLMVVMGINMLGVFSGLGGISVHLPAGISGKLSKILPHTSSGKTSKTPLLVGLLNGLMPCGPLQAIQLVALASASPLIGAASMFFFSLGTVPLMLGLGTIVSILGRRFQRAVLRVGAVLVVVFGLAMLSYAANISGLISQSTLLLGIVVFAVAGVLLSLPTGGNRRRALAALCIVVVFLGAHNLMHGGGGAQTGEAGDLVIVDGTQEITTALNFGAYPNITIYENLPVKWTISAEEKVINGCNNMLNIPEYNIYDFALKPGDNVIEFTPKKSGKFSYTCWMGMLNGSISVVKEGKDKESKTDESTTSPYYSEDNNDEYSDSDDYSDNYNDSGNDDGGSTFGCH